MMAALVRGAPALAPSGNHPTGVAPPMPAPLALAPVVPPPAARSGPSEGDRPALASEVPLAQTTVQEAIPAQVTDLSADHPVAHPPAVQSSLLNLAVVSARMADVPAPIPPAVAPVAPFPSGLAAAVPPPQDAQPGACAALPLGEGPAYLAKAGIPRSVLPPAWRLLDDDLPAAIPIVSADAKQAIRKLHAEIAKLGPHLPPTHRAGANGVSLPLGTCHDRSVSGLHVMNGNALYPALFAAVLEFARHFYFIGTLAACVINYNFYAAWHVDGNNFPGLPSVITVGGTMQAGGVTQFRRADGTLFEVDSRLCPVAFAPTLQHRVKPAEGPGFRTAAVFFMSSCDSPQRILANPAPQLMRTPAPENRPPPQDPTPLVTGLLQAGGSFAVPAPTQRQAENFRAARDQVQQAARAPHPAVVDNSAAAGLSPQQEDAMMHGDELYWMACRELKAAWRSMTNRLPASASTAPPDKPMQAFPPALRVDAIDALALGHPQLTHDWAAAKAWLEVPLLKPPQVNWPRARRTHLAPAHLAAVRNGGICVKYRGRVLMPMPAFAVDRPGKPTVRVVVDGRILNSFLAPAPRIALQSYDDIADIIGPYNVVGDLTSAFLQLPLGKAWFPLTRIVRGYSLARMPPGLSCAAFCMQTVLRVLLAPFERYDAHYDDFLISADAHDQAVAAFGVMAQRCAQARVTVGKMQIMTGKFQHLGVSWHFERNERSLPEPKRRKAVAACEVLRLRNNASHLEVLQAVGVLFHAGEILRAPTLFSGVWREVLSAVARSPMRTRLAAGVQALADIPLDATLTAMRGLLAANRAPMRRPAPPPLPPTAVVFACDAAIEPGTTTYTCVVRVHERSLEVRHCEPIPSGWRIEFAEAHAVAATLPMIQAATPAVTDVVYGEDNEVVRGALRNGWCRARGVSRVIRAVLSTHLLAGRRVWLTAVPSAGQCADVGTRARVPLGEYTGAASADWWSYDRLRAEARCVA